MDELVLEASTREQTGKAHSRRLRHAGQIPGVLYGHGRLEKLALNLHDLNMLLQRVHSEHAVLRCTVDGQPVDVLIKDVQRDRVTHSIEHIDLLVVDLDEEVTITVPIEVRGEPDGVRNFGGVLEIIRRELEVTCKARNIPNAIALDVSPLKVHEVIQVKDVPPIEGITLTDDPEAIVVTVAAPTLHEEVEEKEAEEGEELAEPEVIGERKEEDEEGEEE